MSECGPRRIRLLASFCLLVCTLAACERATPTASKPPSPAAPVANVTVAQWGQEKYLIYLPLYMAMEEGFFADENLSVKLVFTGNDDQTFAAVLSGSAQFGIGDPAFAAIANARGAQASVLGNVVSGVAIWGVTNNDSVRVIEKPADLAGLRVGTFPAPSTNYTLMRAVINEHKDVLANTTIVEAAIGAQLALLESKSADIAMVLEPAASIAESQGYRVVYSSPQFHGPFAFTGITATKQFVRDNSDTTARFVRALQRAVREAHADPTRAVQVARALFPTLEKTVVESAVTRMLREQTFPKDIAVSEQAWSSLLRVRQLAGDLTEPQALGETVDNSFAERARSSP